MIVQNILMDLEFDYTKDELIDKTVVKTSATRNHVADIEKFISSAKEIPRAVESDLPFSCLYQ